MADEKEIEYDLARRYRRAKLREGATSVLQGIYGRDAFSNRIAGDSREAASDAIALGNIDRARNDAAAAARRAMMETDPELKKVALQEYGKILKNISEMLISHSKDTAAGSSQKMATLGGILGKTADTLLQSQGELRKELKDAASVTASEIRQGMLSGSVRMGADGTPVETFVQRLAKIPPEDRAAFIAELRRLDSPDGSIATLLDSGLSGSADQDVYLSEIKKLVADGANASQYNVSRALAGVQAAEPFINEARRMSAGGDNLDKMLDASITAAAPYIEKLGLIIDGPDPESIKAGGALDSMLPSTGVDPDEQAALERARILRDQIGKKQSDVLREALERRAGFSSALDVAQRASTAPVNTDKFFRDYARATVRDRIAPGSFSLPGVSTSTRAPVPEGEREDLDLDQPLPGRPG